MPRGVEPYPMSQPQQYQSHAGPAPPPAKHRRTPHDCAYPPPIATLGPLSPSTPPIGQQRRDSPPPQYATYAPPPPPHHASPSHPGQPHDECYDAHQDAHHYAGVHLQHSGYAPYPVPSAPPQHGTAPTVMRQVVHTDDAARKLSNYVRRRCFNCRTTNTATWRRSNISPGKVLCNKCGLFERTHSRPRPEQFPHKSGPTVGRRSAPQPQPTYQQPHYALPPAASASASVPPSQAPSSAQQQHQQFNWSASHSHARTPLPGAHGNANGNGIPQLPAVDSWAPPAHTNGAERRSAWPRDRVEG
ncbi:hypothetical protein FB451DRAFT_1442915 [Mycena latifolia]|nr:hypothetical protein FB451DRAFT_1442915 [Mycena latifolia]